LPKNEVPNFLYRCGSEFYTTYAKKFEEDSSQIGVVVIENGESAISIVKGAEIKIVETIKRYIPKKHRQGGQSSERFARLRKEAIHDFYKKVGNSIDNIFISPNIQVILIGGIGIAKHNFIAKKYVDKAIKKKVHNIVNVSYNGVQGVKECLKKSQDTIREFKYAKENAIYESFFKYIVNGNQKSVYGRVETLYHLSLGTLSHILISDETSIHDIREFCDRFNTELVVIKKNTENGFALFHTFGGFAGIKRF
jgi:peptide chain release factor subunit 1